MRKIITIFLVCACVLLPATAQASLKAEIGVSVVPVDYTGDPDLVPSLWVCHWLELSTANTTSWIVHADEDILDLHFGTWDIDEGLVPRQQPFGEWSNSCTGSEPGGPPNGPQQPYWQILDLWDGIMPYCTYWEISIDHVPTLNGVAQNLWVHPTPEPATIVLLGLGALSLLRKKR
jgi:hypothetical protein